jgi:hypothetical protein
LHLLMHKNPIQFLGLLKDHRSMFHKKSISYA